MMIPVKLLLPLMGAAEAVVRRMTKEEAEAEAALVRQASTLTLRAEVKQDNHLFMALPMRICLLAAVEKVRL